ncbi:hypothetical protein ASD37_08325 [Mycobacterium sp. Root135]|nr:hypothetical protein ASD37_08325 [Mycobacterium sp. Root135]
MFGSGAVVWNRAVEDSDIGSLPAQTAAGDQQTAQLVAKQFDAWIDRDDPRHSARAWRRGELSQRRKIER